MKCSKRSAACGFSGQRRSINRELSVSRSTAYMPTISRSFWIDVAWPFAPGTTAQCRCTNDLELEPAPARVFIFYNTLAEIDTLGESARSSQSGAAAEVVSGARDTRPEALARAEQRGSPPSLTLRVGMVSRLATLSPHRAVSIILLAFAPALHFHSRLCPTPDKRFRFKTPSGLFLSASTWGEPASRSAWSTMPAARSVFFRCQRSSIAGRKTVRGEWAKRPGR